MLPKRQWMEMTWTDLAETDTGRWIAVLPVAAVEQHGPHLPLGVDSYIAQAYLSRVHEILPDDLPVTFLPVQKLGQSDEHIAYPGTLSLSAQTVIRTYTEIGESLNRVGVRKLVIVTSHGGNVSAMDLVARDLRLRHRMLVVTAAWHRFGYPPGTFDRAEQRHGIHAGDIETSLMTPCAWTAPRTPSPRRSAWRTTSSG
jgi:creatinine amidohydrolase